MRAYIVGLYLPKSGAGALKNEGIHSGFKIEFSQQIGVVVHENEGIHSTTIQPRHQGVGANEKENDI